MPQKNPLIGHTPYDFFEGIRLEAQGRRHVALDFPDWVPLPDEFRLQLPAKLTLGSVRRMRRAFRLLILKMDRAVRAAEKGGARGRR